MFVRRPSPGLRCVVERFGAQGALGLGQPLRLRPRLVRVSQVKYLGLGSVGTFESLALVLHSFCISDSFWPRGVIL